MAVRESLQARIMVSGPVDIDGALARIDRLIADLINVAPDTISHSIVEPRSATTILFSTRTVLEKIKTNVGEAVLACDIAINAVKIAAKIEAAVRPLSGNAMYGWSCNVPQNSC